MLAANRLTLDAAIGTWRDAATAGGAARARWRAPARPRPPDARARARVADRAARRDAARREVCAHMGAPPGPAWCQLARPEAGESARVTAAGYLVLPAVPVRCVQVVAERSSAGQALVELHLSPLEEQVGPYVRREADGGAEFCAAVCAALALAPLRRALRLFFGNALGLGQWAPGRRRVLLAQRVRLWVALPLGALGGPRPAVLAPLVALRLRAVEQHARDLALRRAMGLGATQ